MYFILVALTVAAHFAFVIYVVVGGFIALRWPKTIWFHIAAAIWGLAISTNTVDCPLTWLEGWARSRAGMAALPSQGFIAHYITGVFYPAGWTGAVEAAVSVVVIVSWIVFGWRARTRHARHGS